MLGTQPLRRTVTLQNYGLILFLAFLKCIFPCRSTDLLLCPTQCPARELDKNNQTGLNFCQFQKVNWRLRGRAEGAGSHHSLVLCLVVS